MAMDQTTRMISLQTPLGANELVLTGFRGQEEISRLFRYQLDMISDNSAVDPAGIVGRNVTFQVKLADDTPRFFNGFVSRFAAGDEDEEGGERTHGGICTQERRRSYRHLRPSRDSRGGGGREDRVLMHGKRRLHDLG